MRLNFLAFLFLAASAAYSAPAFHVVGISETDANFVSESGRAISVQIYLEDAPADTVTFSITADIPDQIEVLPDATLVFQTTEFGEENAKTIVLRGLDNDAAEANEDVILSIDPAASADLTYQALAAQDFTLQNENNDPISGNQNPSAVVLISPSSGVTGLTTATDFVIEHPFDPDSDELKLTLCYDQVNTFDQSPRCLDRDEDSLEQIALRQGSVWGQSQVAWSFSGLLMLAALFLRFRRTLLMLLALGFIGACGSKKLLESFRIQPRARWTLNLDELSANQTYYWKVFVSDSKGGIVTSEVRSFHSGANP